MRGNELLDKMELVDPAYVEAADTRPKGEKILGLNGAQQRLASALYLVFPYPQKKRTGKI